MQIGGQVECKRVVKWNAISQPDIIIFANGVSSARFRRKYFPHTGEHSVCTKLADYREQGIANAQLWRFHLNGTVQCYRIQHPSSISAASREARPFLLEQVLRKDAAENYEYPPSTGSE